LEAMLGIEPR